MFLAYHYPQPLKMSRYAHFWGYDLSLASTSTWRLIFRRLISLWQPPPTTPENEYDSSFSGEIPNTVYNYVLILSIAWENMEILMLYRFPITWLLLAFLLPKIWFVCSQIKQIIELSLTSSTSLLYKFQNQLQVLFRVTVQWLSIFGICYLCLSRDPIVRPFLWRSSNSLIDYITTYSK